MSIASVSSSPASVLPSINSPRQAFGQLASAIQSGNLTAAQSAYSTLTQAGNADPNSPFAAAVSQIGDALQSGNISQAQQDLSSLQQQFQSAKGAHHHGHHHVSDGDKSQAATSPSSATPSDSATGTTSSDPTAPTTSTNLVNLTA